MLSRTRWLCARFFKEWSQDRRRNIGTRKDRRRAFLEQLESREVLHAPIPPEFPVPPPDVPNPPPEFPNPVADHPGANLGPLGDLFISAASGAAYNNQLRLSTDEAGNYYVTDAYFTWQDVDHIPNAWVSEDGHTLVYPAGGVFQQQILINGGDGDDNLTVDFSGGNPIPLGGLKFDGGNQMSARGDEITLGAGDVETVDYVFINENDGSIAVDGRTFDYVGLEPVTDNLSAATRSFTYTGGPETISVINGAADGMTEIDSDLAGEIVTFFSAPTTSLTISTNGGDTTNMTSFDPGFNSPQLILEGTGGTNTFNLGAADVIPNATGLTLLGNANFNLNGFSDTIGSLTSGVATTGVTLSSGQTLTVGDTTSTTFAGVISGAGSLTKTGTGTLTLTGTNTYSGSTTITAGTVSANSSAAIGDGSTTNSLVLNGGRLLAAAAITSPATRGVVLNGASTSIIDTGIVAVTIAGVVSGGTNGVNSLTVNAASSAGNLVLSGNNTFQGNVIVNRGTISAQHSNALGASGAGNTTTVNGADGTTASRLLLNNATAVNIPESLFLLGSTGGRVTLEANSAVTHTVSGPIDVSANTNLVQFTSGSTGAMSVTGDITGTMSNGAVLFIRGASTSTNNGLLGSVNLVGGSLRKTDAGFWSIGAASKTYSWPTDTLIAFGTVRLNVSNVFPAGNTVTLGQGNNSSTATLNLNNFNQTVSGLIFNYATATTAFGTITTGTGTLTLNGDFSLSTSNAHTAGAVINGNLNLGGATRTFTVPDSTGAATELTVGAVITNGGVTKAGTGLMVLSGTSTYNSPTTVTAGTLTVNGSIALSATTVQTGATLTGSGTTGPLTVDAGGIQAPGTPTGRMTVTGNYVENGTLQMQIATPSGNVAGTDYDQVRILGNGSATLTGSTLAVTYTGAAGTFAPGQGQAYTLIDNDGNVASDTIGTFAGLAEGATVSVDGINLTISYSGGDGNDVVLKAPGVAITMLYVDASFTSSGATVDGDREAAGPQNAIVGTTAFANIASALAANVGYSGPITVNGGTYPSALLAGGGSVSLRLVQDLVASEFNVTFSDLSGDAADDIVIRAGAANGNLTVEQGSFAGVISGAGNLTKTTAGTLTLTAANTYTGQTTISGGILSANSSAAIGSGVATNTLILDGGTLQAAAAITSPTTRGVVLNAASTSTIDTNNVAVTIAGVISGGTNAVNSLTVNSTGGTAGNLVLQGANTFAGNVVVNRGTVSVQNSSALGLSGAGNVTTVIGADAATATHLLLNGTTAMSIAETLNLNASATGRVGLDASSAVIHTLTGPIDVTSTGTVVQINSGSTGALSITGDITGNMTGGAIVFIRGGSTNTSNGLLGSVNLVGGPLSKTDGGFWSIGAAGKTYAWPTDTLIAFGTVRLNTANALPVGNTVTLGQNNNSSTATLNLNGFNQTVTGITFNYAGTTTNNFGTITTGAGTLTLNGDVTVNTVNTNTTSSVINGNLNLGGSTRTFNIGDSTGAITELTVGAIVSNGSLTKSGPGLMVLSGASTYPGATTVSAGVLVVTGSITPSTTTVQSGAALAGNGTTGLVTVNPGGFHAPGIPLGQETTTGNYVQNGTLQIEILTPSGSVVGTDYDQVRVVGSGSVNLTGSTLAMVYLGAAGTFNPGPGQTYMLIDNDGTAAADTVGTFAGLAQGATVTVDGKAMTISYIGGDGNDVVLTAPGAAATALYVNDQFTGSGAVDGDLETAGVQSATIGTTAFATIADALTANPGYAGVIVVNGGTYPSALLAGGGAVTLRLVQDLANNEFDITFTDLSGDASDGIVTRFNNAVNANLIVAQGSFSGVISGTGNLTKTTAGTLNLLGTNTYTGVTSFSGGILNAATITNYGVPGSLGNRAAGDEVAPGDGIGLVFRGGTLQYTGSTPQSTNRQIRVQTTNATIDASGSVPTATLSFTYNTTNTNWFDTPGVRTLFLTGTNTGANTFSHQIRDQGGNLTNVTKTGAGTWFLNNNTSDYTGITAFSGGVLNGSSITDYGVPSAFGARLLSQETNAADTIGFVFRGGTMQYTGATAQTSNRQMRVQTTGGTIDASGSVPAATLSFTYTGANINWFDTGGTRTFTLTGTNTGANTYANRIENQAANATALTKSGAGSWSVSGLNIYTGATTISGGTLRNGSATTFTGTSALSMSGTGVFDLNGFNASVTNVPASVATNTITNNGAAATFTETAQSSTISALLTDGTGVLTVALSNANSGVTPFLLTSPNTFSGGVRLLNSAAGTRLRVTGLITTVGTPGAIVSSPFGRGAITVGTVATDRSQILFDTAANNTLVNNVIVNTALGTDVFGAFRLDTTGHTFSGTITANLANVKFAPNAGSGTLTGQVTGPFGIEVLTAGGITLNNVTASPNNYQGTTLVGVTGILRLGAANQIPNGATAGLTQVDGTLNLNGFSDTINGLAGQGIVDGISGTPTLTFGDNNATGNDFGGVLRNTAGTLSIAKIGTGVQTISGTNTYSGNTDITAGTLQTGVNVPITNFSFETPALALNTNSYNNAAGTWTFLANSGLINGNGGGFNPAARVNGNQNGFVQQTGNFSQSITFASAGTYTIRFLTEARSSGGNPFNVRVDGTIVQANILPAASTSFNLITIPGVVLTAGAHTLQFEGLEPTLDRTSFIDYVTISGSGTANAIPDSSVVTVGAAGTLSLANSNETIGPLNGAAGSSVTLGTGSLTINSTAAGTFSGVISGAGTVTKNNTNTQTLAGANTYTGATTIAGGSLAVTGSLVSAPTVQTGATLTGTGGTGLLTVNTGGTHAPGTTIGTTTVTGNYVENGALQIQIGSPSGSLAGTDYDQVRVIGSGSVSIGAAATLTVTYTGAAGTFNPPGGQVYVLIDNDGTAPADTTGTFNGLPGGSTITVDGKALTLQYNGGDGNDVVLIAPNNNIYVDDDFPATGTVDGDLELAGPQNAVMGTSAFQSVAAALAANPGYAGIIVVNGGVYTGGALLAGGGNVTLRLVQDLTNGEQNVTFNSLSGDAGDQIITRFYGSANANLIVTSGAFSGVISGAGNVLKTTAGTVTLSGANTYSGLTDVQAGVLTITNPAALGTTAGATTVASGAQLRLSGGFVVSGESVTINGGGGDNLGALNNLSGNNEWAGPLVIGTGATNNRVGATAGNLTLSGVISGGQVGSMGGLTVRNGAGTTIVTGGSNTYLGDTTVVVGTLRLAGGANRLPLGTKLAIGNTASVSPAILDLNGQNQTVAGLYTLNSTMVLEVTNSGAPATLTVDLTTGTDTYGGVITGAVNLTKSGAGVLALTTAGGNNSNTYTGTTLVSGGRLHLNKTAGQNAIPGQLDITSGGMVTFGANNQIADTASVNVGGATSIFNGTGFNGGQLTDLQETIANLTVTGGTFQTGAGANWNITGTGSFTGGAGNTIFLGNSNSAISFGTLSLTGMTATPGGTVQTNNSFAIYGAGPGVGTVTVGSGGLALTGSVFNLRRGTAGSRLVLNGGVTSTGTSSIIIDPGSGAGGIGQVELSGTAGPANRPFNVTSGTLTVSAPIVDGAATPGSLTKSGTGTLVLNSTNTYTGTTDVNGGTLQLAGGAAIADTAGAVNVGLGGTLQLLADETISSYAGAGDTVAANDSTLALGAFMLKTTGSATLANVTGSSGATIIAGTSITDADDDNNITGPNIVLQAASGIGTSSNPLETTVANLEATGGSGGVFLANSGDLIIGGVSTLVGVSATGGAINVSTAGNLTMNENVTSPAAVTLSAGNNATLTGNVSSGTTITVNVDFGDVDAAGGIFNLTGTLIAPGGATLNGDSNNDTFNLRPQTGAAITVNGLDPQMTVTGDVLNLDLTGAVNQQLSLGSIGSGVWTFDAPLQTVSYTSIEEMNANAPYHLALNANAAAFGNTGVADEITIRQSGANLIVERTGVATAPDNDDVGVIFQGAIAAIQSFTYIGSGDADVLTVSDVGGLPQFGSTAPGIPDNANLPGTGSVLLDGNGGADELSFSLTGANAALTYAIGNGSGTAGPEGEVRVTSGVLSLQAYVVDTELIERTGTGATPGALSILGDSGVNAIAVTASGTDTVVSAAGYPSLSFTGNNFSALTIDGLGNADTIELIGLGTGQTNNAPITLSGGLGDDTLRVHSTSGNTGTVTLNGNAGSDLFVLQSLTNTVDGIVGPVIVDGTDGIVASNDDRLTIVDSGDATADTVFVNAVNAATSSDYRVEGISSTTGDDVIFRNIDTLTYTGTSGNDTIDAQFVNTSPPHDLSVATLNGWTGGDQFYLFTSDQIGGTAPTPTGTPSGLASIALNGDAPGNPNAGDGNDIFGQTPPGLTGTGAGNAGLAVPDTVRGIRPSASSSITINGGQPTAPVGTPGDSVGDVLNLDLSGVPLASSFVLATLSGLIASPGLEPLNYGQIEDLNFVTNNQLLNLQLGDTLVRATSGPDTIIFSRNPTPTMPNGTRVRLNAQFYDFPMNGKTLTYAGDANDMVTHSNVTFPMEVHGEGGDDYIAGGMGNDFIVGGLGNDQVNASGGDNIVYGDNAPSSADPTPQDSAVGGNDVLSALGGSDVFYGGGGNDSVSPGAGNDYLHGGAGNDILDGHIGDDRVYGGAGNDILSGSEGNDLLSGGEGDDLLLGRDGNDVLIGGGGVDRLDGGSGDDLLVSGSVANEHSSWTSTTNGTTFDGGLYQRASDNDAALLALLTAWSTTGNRSTLSPIANDGVLDLVWGYTGNDDFSITPNEAQDLNSPLMGNDEAF